jgi:hypothetical protein
MTTTKTRVRSDFTYARVLMRLADDEMREEHPNWQHLQELANELLASVATLTQYVEDHKS